MSKRRGLIVLTIESNMDFASSPRFTLGWYENFPELSIFEIFVFARRRKVYAGEEFCLVKIEIFASGLTLTILTLIITGIVGFLYGRRGSSRSDVTKTFIEILEIIECMISVPVVFACCVSI